MWGFSNVLSADEATCQITLGDFYNNPRDGDYLGRLELKQLLPILNYMEYLHFKQLKLVIEWNSSTPSDIQNVFTEPTDNEPVVVSAPTLLFERIMPDRPLSEVIFWDIMVDTLQQDAIPAGVSNIKSTEYFIQAFNNKVVDSIVIINDTGTNTVIGNNVAHAKFQEKYDFYDNNIKLLPNPADSNELQKMMVDKYGSLNIPMLLDKEHVGIGQLSEGDELFDTNIGEFLHTGSWKCLPLNGRKLKSLKLQYTRTNFNDAADEDAFTQIFMGTVLKAVTFDKDGNTVVTYL